VLYLTTSRHFKIQSLVAYLLKKVKHPDAPLLKKNYKMEEKILEIVNAVLENRTKEKLLTLSPLLHLRNDIGFDSLDLAELTVRIEAEYDIDVFEDGIVNTVGEIMHKINNKK
jgi:acyl carrier protein